MPHEEPWSKVTVVLYERQIDSLDRLASDIRFKSAKSGSRKVALSRAEIIRAAVDAALESGIDLTPATSESDLKDLILAQLKKA